jgi:salicylate hydroxylase/6-hydroxynicotinate 3-monooxygenase
VPPGQIEFDKKLVDLDWGGRGVTLRFADGSKAEAGAVVAADGIHSRVRELWLGPETVNHTGRVAYRTTFPAALLEGHAIDQCCKWWGPDRHIVIYYVTANRDEVYFVTSVPEPEFTVESWSATGDLNALRSPSQASTSRSSAWCTPARPYTNGRSSTAIRCPAGGKARWCCSATPPIR